MKLLPVLLSFSLSLSGIVAVAQNSADEYLKDDIERYAGIYHSYETPVPDGVKAPKGYKPFYISHLGRHGSRWHASPSRYHRPLEMLRAADRDGVLTEQGKRLLKDVEVIVEDAELRWGDLSPRGVREHRGIAERMYYNYPEVFSTKNAGGRIESRSTMIIRCVLSMAANNERLKELNPELQMMRESSNRNLKFLEADKLRHEAHKLALKVSDSVRREWIKPDRFFSSIISDAEHISKIKDRGEIMYDLFLLACGMQDVDYLNISFYDMFTREELYDLWRCVNAYCYYTMGPSVRFGDGRRTEAKALLRAVLKQDEAVLAGKKELAANLRFGHDSNVIPMLALLGVDYADKRVATADEVAGVWNAAEVSPMATNIQFVFFRNKKGDVKVRCLHNERDMPLPLEGGPFYDWEELHDYLREISAE